MKIKVAFTREIKPDIVSRGIMKFLKTPYSHVFFIFNGVIFHAVGKGVSQVPLDEYLKTHKIVKFYDRELFMTPGEFMAYMAGAEGKEYSNSQYLGFISKFFRRFVRNGSEKMICSELVADVLKKYGSPEIQKLLELTDLDFVSPLDVDKLLEGLEHG